MGDLQTIGADGVVTRNGAIYDIVFERRLKQPIDKVWAALTVPERLADWLGVVTPQGKGVLSVGDRFELFFPHADYRTLCQVVAVEPPRLFAWTWGLPDGPAQLANAVRFELAPDGDGCILTMTNPGLMREDLESVASGWHVHLAALDGAVDGVRGEWSEAAEKPHRDHYAAMLAEL